MFRSKLSQLIELFELTFGQYAKKVPSTVFTKIGSNPLRKEGG